MYTKRSKIFYVNEFDETISKYIRTYLLFPHYYSKIHAETP